MLDVLLLHLLNYLRYLLLLVLIDYHKLQVIHRHLNFLLVLYYCFLALDRLNKDVTELALQGKIQPGKYSVKAINENPNYALTSNSIELTINPALDPITVVKTQVSVPVIPVTTAPVVTVNTPTTQKIEINNNLALKLGVDSGSVNLVSQTIVGQPNQVVTLSELKTSSQENSNSNEKKEVKLEDVRVSLNQNSIVQIVNGGVNLPTGVD